MVCSLTLDYLTVLYYKTILTITYGGSYQAFTHIDLYSNQLPFSSEVHLKTQPHIAITSIHVFVRLFTSM